MACYFYIDKAIINYYNKDEKLITKFNEYFYKNHNRIQLNYEQILKNIYTFTKLLYEVKTENTISCCHRIKEKLSNEYNRTILTTNYTPFVENYFVSGL